MLKQDAFDHATARSGRRYFDLDPFNILSDRSDLDLIGRLIRERRECTLTRLQRFSLAWIVARFSVIQIGWTDANSRQAHSAVLSFRMKPALQFTPKGSRNDRDLAFGRETVCT